MRRLAFFLATALIASQVLAQSWPSRPVRVVVPLGAGGFADVPARILAPRLDEQTLAHKMAPKGGAELARAK